MGSDRVGSTSHARPALVTTMFRGLTAPWRNPRECSVSRPRSTSIAIARVRSQGDAPCAITSSSAVPSRNGRRVRVTSSVDSMSVGRISRVHTARFSSAGGSWAGQWLSQFLDHDGGAVRSLRAEHAEDSAAVGDDPVDVDPVQDRRTLDGVASHQRLQRSLEEGVARGIGIARIGAEAPARPRRLVMSVLQRFDLTLARRHDRSQIPGDLRHLFLDHLEVVGAHRHGSQGGRHPDGPHPSLEPQERDLAHHVSRVRASSRPHRPS